LTVSRRHESSVGLYLRHGHSSSVVKVHRSLASVWASCCSISRSRRQRSAALADLLLDLQCDYIHK